MPAPRADEAKIQKALENNGYNFAQAAKELRIARSTVYEYANRNGIRGQGKGGAATIAPPDDEVRRLHAECGGVYERMGERLGRNPSTVRLWCKRLGLKSSGAAAYASAYPQQIEETVDDGFVVCFSDAHWWFEEKSRAHEALIVALKKLKPVVVIANGDVLDGARISRHDPSGVDATPKLEDELEVTKRHMAEIARLAKGARRYVPLGNHDSRLSRYLVNHAPEFEGLDGTRLDHHILGWEFCMSVVINGNVMVKHAFRGGLHATWNNTLHDGRTIVTGHLHAQMVRPHTDARGTRWGVDLGCLADPSWPQFNYALNNTKNWRSGFGVLEFRGGTLLPPMLATVQDDASVWLQRNERLI